MRLWLESQHMGAKGASIPGQRTQKQVGCHSRVNQGGNRADFLRENTQASGLRLRWSQFKNAVPLWKERAWAQPFTCVSVEQRVCTCAVCLSMLDKGRELPTVLTSQGWNYGEFESVFCCCNKVLETGSFKTKESCLGSWFQGLASTSGDFVLFQLMKKGRRKAEGQTGLCVVVGTGWGTEMLGNNQLWWSLTMSWKNSINPPDLQGTLSSCSTVATEVQYQLWCEKITFKPAWAQGINSYLHILLCIFLHFDA